jgi:tetratricopeptide (TPR) repeat protein
MSNTEKKALKRKRRKRQDRKRSTLSLVHAGSPQVVPEFHLDRRAMEGTMARMFTGLNARDGSAADRAQDVMYQAWEADDLKTRVALAKKALEISADCADAYVLLSEEARNAGEARRLLEQGVAAGERALGREYFEENAGHFWGLLETRPYMRARQGLAQILWAQGERDAAVAHYQEILRLNPRDNQGVRDPLVTCLLQMGRDQEAEEVMSRFEEDGMAWMAYSRALVAFRREGDSEKSRKLVRAAVKHNRHVPAYLLGRKKSPQTLPDYHGFGDDDEAVCYASDGIENWRATPGALVWLAAAL